MNRESVHNISVRDLDIRKCVCACVHVWGRGGGGQHSDAGLKLKVVEIFVMF